jgi:hypothetical protein
LRTHREKDGSVDNVLHTLGPCQGSQGSQAGQEPRKGGDMGIFTFGAMVFTIGLFLLLLLVLLVLLLLLITWPPLNEVLGQSGTVRDISATQLIFIVLLGHWLGVDEHVGDSGTVDGVAPAAKTSKGWR